MKPIRLISGFLTVGVWTLLSRVLGFVRDILIAGFLGAGPVAEAFLIAFALPNMFRRFFAEGAFNMAFVPMFSKKLEKGDDPVGFARDAFAGLATILIVLTVIAQVIMPWLVLAMAGGFAADGRLDLAVGYGRITFIYILFISLAALASGVLNASGRFAAAAAAPVLLNIVLITAVWLSSAGCKCSPEELQAWTGMFLAWGVPIAGVAQLALVWWAAHRAGFTLLPRLPRMTPEIKRLAIIATPAMLAGGVVQVNLLVGRQVASFYDGAIAWLSYADRLYQLPLGVVAIALGVVLLPDLSRRLAAGDDDGGRDAYNRASELALALTIPAAVALIVIPVPLVEVLFMRGAFTSDDAAATALAVMVYGAGLPAFVLQKALQPLYFARGDTKRPFYFAAVAMVVNAVVAIGLSFYVGYIAAAIATTLAGWVMVWQLWRGSRSMGDAAKFDARFKSRFWRIVLSSVLMGAVLLGAVLLVGPALGMATIRYFALAVVVFIGIASYFGIGHLMGAFRLSEFKAAMRRG
ncbi:putative peptidoglycan lipid II flippase [Octadecabacter temperatus]|uniref:Probable lipid II flippase MurJ n=1 Tax=Octadecabacter temperatus TaxID=1458307 RepID=A0A0K0Y2E9_9RHOB|nr:murein biosynthesis integral membrane protein MurJ [Octadecabacter temperatus]AKS45076.1 putative peptidoglycan biosynthesis protein MurJ [Octadecabacter temperatus]SIN85735.1 putative peptidoglycan lipid II flippase [Octadecabacter temperatus]